MKLDPVLLLVLTGHLLGDFYLQGSSLAKNKDRRVGALLLHLGEYGLCLAGVLALGTAGRDWLPLCLWAAGAHGAIDGLKFLFLQLFRRVRAVQILPRPRLVRQEPPGTLGPPSWLFFGDQALHLLALLLLWRWLGRALVVHPLLLRSFHHLPGVSVLWMLTGVLTILRPAGIAIGHILSVSGLKSSGGPGGVKAGAMIGYLERSLIFLLILNGQYGAIAFVMAAKSIARFKDIENQRETAEYYLIGTLLSIVAAFAVTFALGLG